MRTYMKIKQLSGKENDRMIQVLRHIAKEEGYISCGNVQFKKLYYNVLKEKFVLTSKKDLFQGRMVTISIRQYRRLRKYTRGRFSINTAVYLLALYDIMYGYQEKPGFVPHIDNITYTQYVVDLLLSQINIILDPNNNNPDYIAPDDYEIFSAIYNDFVKLDNITGGNDFKLYNNIW